MPIEVLRRDEAEKCGEAMNDSGQLEGRHAIREGYTHDSTGEAIRGGTLYWWEGERWVGITAMWRLGTKRPKVMVPVKKLMRS